MYYILIYLCSNYIIVVIHFWTLTIENIYAHNVVRIIQNILKFVYYEWSLKYDKKKGVQTNLTKSRVDKVIQA